MKFSKRPVISGIILLIWYFGLVLTTITGKPTTSYTIIAEADADVDSTETSANTGGQSYLEISNAQNMFQGIRIGYIRFDLSDVPGTVSVAILKLYTSSVTETHNIGIHECSDISWNELTINYNNKPSYDQTALDTELVASDGTWYSWTVTSAVNNAVSTGKVTLVVVSEDQHDTAWIWFRSKDQQYSWMEEYRPKLEVTTTTTTNGEQAETSEETSGFQIFLILFTIGSIVLVIKKKMR